MLTKRRDAALEWCTTSQARDVLTVGVIVLLMSGQGFRYLLGIPLYGVVCLAAVVLVAIAFRPTWRSIRPPLLIGAFVALAVASVLWSATRSVTLLASLVLVVTTFVAIVTVRGVSNARFMVLLYRGLQISLYLGVAFEMVVAIVVRAPLAPLSSDMMDLAEPGTGAEGLLWSENRLFEGGPIQGFVGNRNPFGMLALLAAIVALVMLLERRIRPIDGVATLVIAGAVHVLTLSATVTAAGFYVAVLVLGARQMRRAKARTKKVLSFGLLAVTAIAAVLTLKYRELLFELLDRRTDFSNRTFIWDAVVDFAVQRPEGWGYVGYWPVWTEPYSSIVEHVNEESRYPALATHAHNAFLDSWLQLGLIGLALLLMIVVLMFGSAWRLVERAERSDSYIPLGWVLLAAVMSLLALTESRMLVEGGWYLLVVLYCMGPQVFTLTIVDPDMVHNGSRLEMRPARLRKRRPADPDSR